MLEKFPNSIYYPGGGTDLQVLLRFSDICDTVISPTLSDYLTIEKYDELFKLKCDNINSFYSDNILIYDGYDIVESDFIKQNKFIPYPQGLFTEGEISDYQEAFKHHYGKNNFVVQFKFRRIIGKISRPIFWIALNTEGLASLISLCHLTKSQPKIICTIQSLCFEKPDSLFVRLLGKLNLSTKIWIRGFWQESPLSFSNIPISEFPPYQFTVQEFGLWNSLMGAPIVRYENNHTQNILSKVKAFSNISKLEIPEIFELVHDQNPNRIIKIINGDIIGSFINDFELIITTKRIENKIPLGCNSIIFWEDLYDRTGSEYPLLTFHESIQKLKQILKERNIKFVAITPIGFEDETLYLKEFLNDDICDLNLSIYHRRQLDFLKLKAPNLL
jgi:hypothetical protein